jgi:hypothetical protein
MRSRVGVLLLACMCAAVVTAQVPQSVPNGLPSWAFNIPDPVQFPSPVPKGIVRVPGSSREFDWAVVAGNNNPPDWFPDEHGPAS